VVVLPFLSKPPIMYTLPPKTAPTISDLAIDIGAPVLQNDSIVAKDEFNGMRTITNRRKETVDLDTKLVINTMVHEIIFFSAIKYLPGDLSRLYQG
jgi:hypothetical protein